MKRAPRPAPRRPASSRPDSTGNTANSSTGPQSGAGSDFSATPPPRRPGLTPPKPRRRPPRQTTSEGGYSEGGYDGPSSAYSPNDYSEGQSAAGRSSGAARSRGERPVGERPIGARARAAAGEARRAAAERGRQTARPSSSRAQRTSLPLAPQVLLQRPLDPPADRDFPVVELRTPVLRPWLFRKQLGRFDRTAQPGDVVALHHNEQVKGYGIFNPRAEMAIRVLSYEDSVPGQEWFTTQLSQAVDFRRKVLGLDRVTNAYRIVHAEADGLPGVMIDRFADVLVVEAFSLGMYQRAEAMLEILTPLCGTRHGLLKPAPMSLDHEGFEVDGIASADFPEQTVIQEAGTKFSIDFTTGQKTGFYCDQRDNRLQLAEMCAGARVLDLCTYAGGFALQAKRVGKAAEVTGVDIDEDAIAMATRNAEINGLDVRFVQADAFAFAREQQQLGEKYDVVVLDPPKLIRTRDEGHDGRNRYFDLNKLAASLVRPGGWLLTCSCSGMLERSEFIRLVSAAVSATTRGQIIDTGGAAPDHPVATDCLETEYLKTVWIRITG